MGGKPEANDPPSVPEHEFRIEFVRSSGPGGQNVNKTSSKAQLRWKVGKSQAFTEEQKALIRLAAGNRLNNEDEIVISDQTTREQPQNKAKAIERLQDLVAKALTPKKEREMTETKEVREAKERARLEAKFRKKETKQQRREPKGGW
jgi:ribosome-associated protein